MRVKMDEIYEVTQVGLRLSRMLITRHKFVCFDVISRLDTDYNI